MNPHNHAVSHAGNSMSRHTVFDGIDLMFLDVKQETISILCKITYKDVCHKSL